MGEALLAFSSEGWHGLAVMLRGRLLLLCVAFVVLLGCAPPPPRTVSMRVKGGHPDATVHIDDMYIGSFSMVEGRGVALPPGKHRISVERSGYFPWDVVVVVAEGDPPVHLDVELRRIPD
jgi:hypothetical protein